MPSRIKIIFWVVLAVFLLVLGKLFYWQVIKRQYLLVLAGNQYGGYKKILAPRGRIYSDDNFPIVTNQVFFDLYVNPKEIKKKPEELVEELSSLTLINNLNWEMLNNKDLYWMPLAKGMTEKNKRQIEDAGISGFSFEEKFQRYYPEASMAARLLGFVGADKSEDEKGYFGLEGYYNNELKSKPGMVYFEQNALGEPILDGKIREEKPIPGRDLRTSINRVLQYQVENSLKQALESTGAVEGWVLIMGVKSGEIIASASLPSYSPVNFYEYQTEIFRDPVVSSVFEPGSIFKVITMACAIESGAVKQDDICTKCNGPRTISDYQIKTWNEKYYPDSTMTDIIVHSDNVGMVFVIEKLGAPKFINCVKKFGFGSQTGIDLQGEISGSIKTLKEMSDVDLATSSFGQGIAVSPIQILNGVNAIANKGEIVQPNIVKSIIEAGKEIEIETKNKRRVISADTALEITKMMISAVENSNVKKLAGFKFKIAGKSGTAQIPVEGHYDPNKTIASYVGFFPADNPRFSMLVTLKEPKSSIWAEGTAAPLWFNIAHTISRNWQLE